MGAAAKQKFVAESTALIGSHFCRDLNIRKKEYGQWEYMKN